MNDLDLLNNQTVSVYPNPNPNISVNIDDLLNNTLNPTVLTNNSLSPTASVSATLSPTAAPSMSTMNEAEMNFFQEFWVGNGREFGEDELVRIQVLYQSYAENFAPALSLITRMEAHTQIRPTCTINRQVGSIPNEGSIPTDDSSTDLLLSFKIDFLMRYESRYHNVTSYPQAFQNYINSNLDLVVVQMQTLGLDVAQLDKATRVVVRTPAPSASQMPSANPVAIPASSFLPTRAEVPLVAPTTATASARGAVNVVTVAVSLSIASLLAIIGIGLVARHYYCRKGRKVDPRRDAPGKEAQQPTHVGVDVETNNNSSNNGSSNYNGGTYSTAATSAFDADAV